VELRERLRSLKSSSSSPKSFEKPSPLPYLLPLENSHGLTYFADKIYIDYHGQIDLRNFPDSTSDTVRFLSLDDSLGEIRSNDLLFLDIETTGTSGGAGTFAFLVGLGFVDQGYFQVRQYFLHDLSQESSFLHAISEFVARFPYLVTYNGKCFDAQILKTRYLLHRRDDPLAAKQHIDMLFIARRLWKRSFRDCDLINLERNVLGFYRADDIPGFLIPSAYTDYLRFANSSLIQQVIHHNQWDILSLAVLFARACQLASSSELSSVEHFSLSLICQRQKQFAKAIEHQMKALDGSEGILQTEILIALARNLRRISDPDRMKWLVSRVETQFHDSELSRRLAILCEHDLKDYSAALRFTEAQISRLEKFRGIATKHDSYEEWKRRQQRLTTKTLRSKDRHQEKIF